MTVFTEISIPLPSETRGTDQMDSGTGESDWSGHLGDDEASSSNSATGGEFHACKVSGLFLRDNFFEISAE